MVFSELDAPAAARTLGPAAHAEVADALAPHLSDAEAPAAVGRA
jgi:hypothetical protein